MMSRLFTRLGHFPGHFRSCLSHPSIEHACKRWLAYTQGQSPVPGSREYFYYIDHQGMLFLDDSKMKNFTSCIKDKKFLHFFFTRIRPNATARYESEFPFVSHCGRERNYIRCDDTPVVFSHIFTKTATDGKGDCYQFAFGNAGELLYHDFQPEHICMVPETGRVYHPAHEFYGGFGLIKSSLSIEISNSFLYESDDVSDGTLNSSGRKLYPQPTHFMFEGVKYELSNLLLDLIYSKPFIPC